MEKNKLPLSAALLLALSVNLAACGDAGDEEATPEPAEMPRPVEPDGGIGDGATPPPPPPGTDRTAAIPAEMQGRWGLKPADCRSEAAEGLLTVAPDRLTFYESVGELGDVTARTDNRIRATYAFTGEGMNWTRDVSLTLEDDGRTLVRRERGSEASPGAFIYTRCP